MTEAEFRAYREEAVKTYAEEKVAAGNWPAEGALERSEREFSSLLPQGVATKGQHLLTLWDPGLNEAVGMLWFAAHEAGRWDFIYDVSVDAARRGQGYGRAALQALEDHVKALGVTAISLHVFGHNHAARTLYESLSYETTNINMTKQL